MTTKEARERALSIFETFPPAPLDTTSANIRRCMQMMERAADIAQAEGYDAEDRRRFAQVAYKLAMPPLSDAKSIKAHIACIANGIALQMIDGREAGQMLYAAQVALSLHNAEERKAKQVAKQQKARRAA